MLFSEQFEISRGGGDDWFDPILDEDTRLFVDPFAIFKEQLGFWSDTHRRIISHFELCFHLIAEGRLNPDSVGYKKARDLLTFPEPKELCLGYTDKGTSGAGSARGYARIMAGLIADAVGRGLDNIDHFEELGIFEKGIGADRISDTACTILKPRLIEYTQTVAATYRLATENHVVKSGQFDDKRQRLTDTMAKLPTNPFTEGPILLVPQRFLDTLPAINKDDWWHALENERLRDDMSYEVLGSVNKKLIVEAARDNPGFVHEWASIREADPATSYDLDADPALLYRWDPVSKQYVAENPIELPDAQSDEEFFEVIETVVEQFKLFIEQQGGWDFLWNGADERYEDAVQRLFKGIAKHYCQANGIVLDREVELGRGPVDFKFSNGYSKRAHLEIKKVHSGKFWHGLEVQLPTYMKADEVDDAWFMAVRYRDTEGQIKRIEKLPEIVREAAERHNRNLRYVLIDARRPPSASVA